MQYEVFKVNSTESVIVEAESFDEAEALAVGARGWDATKVASVCLDDDCYGCGWTVGTCQCNQPEISDRAECDL